MPPSCDVLFASSNENKFSEVRQILGRLGVRPELYRCDLTEIQSGDMREIASYKADRAFELCKEPVIVEDDGLFVDPLGGFPGPYSSYVFETIGNDGILRLLGTERGASFRSVIAYRDPAHRAMIFEGSVRGTIPDAPRGAGWGYDPIFVPSGAQRTFGEDKHVMTHRRDALERFAEWFRRRR